MSGLLFRTHAWSNRKLTCDEQRPVDAMADAVLGECLRLTKWSAAYGVGSPVTVVLLSKQLASSRILAYIAFVFKSHSCASLPSTAMMLPFARRAVVTAMLCLQAVAAVSISHPQVRLDQATFAGVHNGTVDVFLGIPFAEPPTGDLRFRLPVANKPYVGSHDATNFGPACLQLPIVYTIPDDFAPEAKAVLEEQSSAGDLANTSEDCLTINVWKPSNVPNHEKLPVVIWMYGGGFQERGSISYDGSVIVRRSIEMGKPILYVSMNYRLAMFGFLASAEVKAAGVGNLGLQDQRQAFRWVQKYIAAFNGDPSKVTIWGESAGAISASLHLLANGGNHEGLFRGAFIESGPPIPTGDITHGQGYYNELVATVGCQTAHDSLQCLREVPIDDLVAAQQKLDTPNLFVPRADGSFIVKPPLEMVLEGTVADVPIVIGQCDDEGTLFAVGLMSITTDEQVQAILAAVFPNATASELDRLMELYPQDVTQGSPFDTGYDNALTPQYKRLAAIQGDLVLIAPRRFFLQQRSDKQPTWSYTSKRMKTLPDLGSYHDHDLANIYGPGDMTDYLVNFVNHLDPNGKNLTSWPQYSTSNPTLLTFLDGPIPRGQEQDNFREEAMDYLNNLLLKYPQ
ncbi:carotenoid ester lipase precursor [Irpex rosettiformis]|uniref:Carotenoid ester lipase n=1 Tax=Irpex rosettiformis TaxID=378272 RepID=A0ACB8UBG6_9APHY|nr:carotenoid ester lipase precursor [Irpex rosettiformis]